MCYILSSFKVAKWHRNLFPDCLRPTYSSVLCGISGAGRGKVVPMLCGDIGYVESNEKKDSFNFWINTINISKFFVFCFVTYSYVLSLFLNNNL